MRHMKGELGNETLEIGSEKKEVGSIRWRI